MRRHPDHGPEGPQEVVRAHGRLVREAAQRKLLVGLPLDPAQRSADAPLVHAAWCPPVPPDFAVRRGDDPGKTDRDCFKSDAVALVTRRLGRGLKRDQRRQRWQMRHGECRPLRPWHRSRDTLEEFRREVEREAAVADAVVMATLKAVPVVAKQHRTGGKQGGALGGTILKCPFCHQGHAETIVLFLEGPVTRTCGADDVFGAPARTRW